jgi:hypothetical protein
MQVNTRKLHLVGFRPCGLAKFSSAPRCVQFSPLSIASAAPRRTNLTGNRRPARRTDPLLQKPTYERLEGSDLREFSVTRPLRSGVGLDEISDRLNHQSRFDPALFEWNLRLHNTTGPIRKTPCKGPKVLTNARLSGCCGAALVRRVTA